MKFGIDVVYRSRETLNFVKIGEVSAIFDGVDEFQPSHFSKIVGGRNWVLSSLVC